MGIDHAHVALTVFWPIYLMVLRNENIRIIKQRSNYRRPQCNG